MADRRPKLFRRSASGKKAMRLETIFAKEAKETDRLWWKTPRLFMGSESGIAVRTQWQSGNYKTV